MSVRILVGDDIASFYCSTTDWSFGPVIFSNGSKCAADRAEAFLRWLKLDPRDVILTGGDTSLERKYLEWLAQEDAQYASEEAAESAEVE